MGLFTFQIGFSLTYQIGPVSFNYNGGIAFDGHGNIGFYNTGLVGAGPGAGFSGGISLLGSNGDQIADLNNTFYTASVGGFAGGGASAEGFNGRGSHNQIVVGGGGTFGIGLGGGGYVGPSFTKVSPIYSPNDSSSNGSDSSLGNGNHITTPEPGAIIVTATPLPDLALDEYRLPGAGQAIGTFNGATVYQPNGFVLSSIVGGSAGGFRYDLGPNGSLGGLGGYGFGGFSYVPGASYDVEFGGGGNTVCHPPPMQP